MGSLDLNFGPINDVVFVVEDTSMGGSCMEELYQNYIGKHMRLLKYLGQPF